MTITKQRYKLQEALENTFDQKRVMQMVRDELAADPLVMAMIKTGVTLLTDWVYADYFEGKAKRVQSVAVLDLEEFTFEVIAQVTAYCQKPQTLVSIAARCASTLKMADTIAAIQTMAEVISVLADAELYDIAKLSRAKDASYMVASKYVLDDATTAYMTNTTYLPPMIHRPKKLRHNRSSGYITQQGDSLILGGFQNHHDWDIALDALNSMNANEYELDIEILSTLDEPKPSKLDQAKAEIYLTSEQRKAHQDAIDNFENFKKQSYLLYTFYIYQGNSVFFNHKVDKRGRLYSCGYHLNPQGSSFKKAVLNFKSKAPVTGVEDFLSNCQSMSK